MENIKIIIKIIIDFLCIAWLVTFILCTSYYIVDLSERVQKIEEKIHCIETNL